MQLRLLRVNVAFGSSSLALCGVQAFLCEISGELGFDTQYTPIFENKMGISLQAVCFWEK